MKTPLFIPLCLLLATAACTSDDPMSAARADGSEPMAQRDSDEAIRLRSVRMDERTSCVLKADSATWKTLSLTTDQIRWMEDLRLRMRVQDRNTVTRGDTQYVSYTLSDGERRRMAEILTDDQLEQWIAMCPGEPVAHN